MPTTPPTDADAVLRRAIELKHEEADAEERLSAKELEMVAAELDVEPRYVQAALAEREQAMVVHQDAPSSDGRWHLWGAPRRLKVEELLDRELDQEACEELLEVARQHVGERGRIRSQGGTMVWKRGGWRVAVMPGRGRTHLWIARSMSGTMVALFVPIMVVSLLVALALAIPLGIAYSALWAPIFASLGGLLVVFLAVRALVGSIFSGRAREVEALREALLATSRAPRLTLPSVGEGAELAQERVEVVEEETVGVGR